jgi:hypothetical protein
LPFLCYSTGGPFCVSDIVLENDFPLLKQQISVDAFLSIVYFVLVYGNGSECKHFTVVNMTCAICKYFLFVLKKNNIVGLKPTNSAKHTGALLLIYMCSFYSKESLLYILFFMLVVSTLWLQFLLAVHLIYSFYYNYSIVLLTFYYYVTGAYSSTKDCKIEYMSKFVQQKRSEIQTRNPR